MNWNRIERLNIHEIEWVHHLYQYLQWLHSLVLRQLRHEYHQLIWLVPKVNRIDLWIFLRQNQVDWIDCRYHWNARELPDRYEHGFDVSTNNHR